MLDIICNLMDSGLPWVLLWVCFAGLVWATYEERKKEDEEDD